jgi:hypothetical protein
MLREMIARAMNRAMRAFLALCCLAACATARPSPRAFLEGVYRSDDLSGAGEPPWAASRCPAAFTTRVCALLERDRREAGGEVPRLDGDPLYAAQEMQITDLTFKLLAVVGEHAEVQVTFRNFGVPKELVVTLLGSKGAEWRIDEITYRHELPATTLTGILTAPK